MNWKTFVPIFISLIIAFAGSFFIYQWMAKQKTPVEVVKVVEKDAVPVAVATANLPWGTKIKPEMVKTTPFLKESLPSGYFASSVDLKGRVILTPLKANEPITEDKLAPVSVKAGGVSAILKPGTRAISVKGNKVLGISGLINPGNRVDVIITVTDPAIKKVKSKIVLENLLVLATGTQIQKNEKGEPMPVDVYTLEVTPEQAERLALAGSQGKLNFALRSATDSEDIWTRGITIPQLLASSSWSEVVPAEPEKIQPQEPKKENPPKETIKKVANFPKKKRKWVPRKSITVEMIRGTDLKKKKFTF
ncbi:MAG: Flp pilus assembly protein CpaB [Desulfobacteraceae bacterium]|jgi:pilus assembly protein CpaB